MGPRDPAEAADWEVAHHLAEMVDRLVEGGMTPDEARREAERRFGNPHRYRSRLERNERRRRTTMRRMAAWGSVTGALAGVVRTVRRSPGFAAGVVLTLALGIGANATMFGVLDRLLFSPPAHIVDADAVRRVIIERPFLGRMTHGETLTNPDRRDLEGAASFEAVAARSRAREYTLGSGPDATRIQVSMASWDFFPLLGVHAELGRFYGADEDRIGQPGTAVISHEYWERAFASSRDELGRTLEISGHPFTVIGVAPRGFTGVDLSPVDVWLPLMAAGGMIQGTEWEDNRGWYWFGAIARLTPGVTVEAAEQEATARHRGGRQEMIDKGRYPAEAHVALDPLIVARGPQASGESKVARWLGGVSLLVLLIACANVANLLLARGTRMRREVAVRIALGIGRERLVSMMVIESVLLAVLGGVVALLLALWGGGVVRSALMQGVYFPGSAVGGRVALFAAATAVLAGVLAGFGPALQATRADVSGDLAMGAGASSRRRSRTRSALTVLQAALSVVLLVGAGLFVRSVRQVRDLDLGLDVDHLVMASLEFAETGLFPGTRNDGETGNGGTQERNEVYAAAMQRLRNVPGVASVAATSSPFQWAYATELEVPELDSIPDLPGGGPYFQDVTPGYLGTVGLRVVGGRDLAESDVPGATRVAVVSEMMARTVWPDADPLGRCLLVGEDATECTTVVGVAEDASRGSLEDEPYMTYYMPLAQREDRLASALYVRTTGDPSTVAARIAPILRSIDPQVRFANVETVREMLDPEARAWTLGATMFSVFGALALIVAAIGLYGVLAFDVAQRTREIGIRSALGAERGRLLASVVGTGVRLGAAGVVIGLVVAWVAGRFASDLLFHTSPHDPLVLVGVGVALLVVSFLASFVPGLRATRVDPSEALRAE
jgi:predicted permease